MYDSLDWLENLEVLMNALRWNLIPNRLGNMVESTSLCNLHASTGWFLFLVPFFALFLSFGAS